MWNTVSFKKMYQKYPKSMRAIYLTLKHFLLKVKVEKFTWKIWKRERIYF